MLLQAIPAVSDAFSVQENTESDNNTNKLRSEIGDWEGKIAETITLTDNKGLPRVSIFLIGPKGTGKTSLLLDLVNELKELLDVTVLPEQRDFSVCSPASASSFSSSSSSSSSKRSPQEKKLEKKAQKWQAKAQKWQNKHNRRN
jgi:hypothetical protein